MGLPVNKAPAVETKVGHGARLPHIDTERERPLGRPHTECVIVHLHIPEFKGPAQLLTTQAWAMLHGLVHWKPAMPTDPRPASKPIVHPEPDSQKQARPSAGAAHGQQQRDRTTEVRSLTQPPCPLAQRFADKAKRSVLKVTKTPMEQLR